MREYCLSTLAPLASVEIQRRFVVHGTAERYLLLEDVINDAYHVLERIQRDPVCRDAFSAEEQQMLRALFETLDREAENVPLDGSASNEEIVERNGAWRRIRDEATKTLEALGFDLAAWKARQAD